MQCQNCKTNTATIHLTEINNGQRVEAHLCEQCAQKEGIAVKNQIPLNELLSTLLSVSPELTNDQAAVKDLADAECPSCGMTLGRFRKELLLGCPCDYEIFSAALVPIIEKSQGGHVKHCGKVPSKIPSNAKKQMNLATLQKQLEEAVTNENYEAAAKLRDQIGKME
jgi:protein arginine kinase activator